MLVVAFDGVLFDTLERRARAVVDALGQEGLRTGVEQVMPLLPSRTIAETVRAVVAEQMSSNRVVAHNFDDTSVDLAILRAERSLSASASSGASLRVKLAARLRRAATVTRIVVRADSRRREVEELLRLSEFDSVLAMTRCSDDASSTHRSDANVSSLEQSYSQIVTRMAANRSLLGNASGIGIAFECCPRAREVARAFGFEAPDNIESFAIPGAQ